MCVRVYVWNRGRYTCGAGSVNVWREGRACVMGACVCVCAYVEGRKGMCDGCMCVLCGGREGMCDGCMCGGKEGWCVCTCVEGREGRVCMHVWREGRACVMGV